MIKPEETKIALELRKFLKKDNVFVKRAAFSIFRVEKFKKFVKDKSISKFYICGLDTHACVYMSTMEAFERGFDVKVIEDLCAASHGISYHQNAIDSLKRNLGKNIIINSKNISR
jgi:nicotinamidase/pyrazinamidase